VTRAFAFDILPPALPLVLPWIHEGLGEHYRGEWSEADVAQLRRLIASGAVRVGAAREWSVDRVYSETFELSPAEFDRACEDYIQQRILAASAPTEPAFDVASVKPNPSGDFGVSLRISPSDWRRTNRRPSTLLRRFSVGVRLISSTTTTSLGVGSRSKPRWLQGGAAYRRLRPDAS